jgi:hypothetical protein
MAQRMAKGFVNTKRSDSNGGGRGHNGGFSSGNHPAEVSDDLGEAPMDLDLEEASLPSSSDARHSNPFDNGGAGAGVMIILPSKFLNQLTNSSSFFFCSPMFLTTP